MKKTTTAQAMRQRFGALMMEARESKKLTIEQVARKVRTHKGYISTIERAVQPPPRPQIVRRWAKAIGVPVARALALRQLSDIPEDLPLAEIETVIGAYVGEISPKPEVAPAPVEKAG